MNQEIYPIYIGHFLSKLKIAITELKVIGGRKISVAKCIER